MCLLLFFHFLLVFVKRHGQLVDLGLYKYFYYYYHLLKTVCSAVRCSFSLV